MRQDTKDTISGTALLLTIALTDNGTADQELFRSRFFDRMYSNVSRLSVASEKIEAGIVNCGLLGWNRNVSLAAGWAVESRSVNELH